MKYHPCRKRSLKQWLARPNLALVQHRAENNPIRVEVENITRSLGIPKLPLATEEDYWQNLFNHKFVISPAG